MILGSVPASKLGKSQFPHTIKGSWAIKDNLLDAYVASRKAELASAIKTKAKYTKIVTRIKSELKLAKEYSCH